MNSPIRYIGSKNRLANHILPFVPIHNAFVDVFGGSGAMLFNKEPGMSRLEVYNDVDSYIVNFFRVLREQTSELQRLCQLTPYSREEHRFCGKGIADASITDLERARRVYTYYRQAYAGKHGATWAFSKGETNQAGTFANTSDDLMKAAERLRQWQIENGDFEKIIKQYGVSGNFLYCDPPYLPELRNSANDACYCTDDLVCYRCAVYRHEMPPSEHERFLKAIRASPAMAIVSGYDSEMYNDYLWHWSMYKKTVTVNCSNVTNQTRETAEEIIWVNPSCELALSRIEQLARVS